MSRRNSPDVFIAGGGPAGLAAAIRAAEKGFRVAVADHARPPIDKACGEGLMPDAAMALVALGVQLPPGAAAPFRGIRFLDAETGASAEVRFSNGTGFGVRRTILHARLVERAAQAGVRFAWGARVTGLGSGEVECDGERIRSRWIVGADGLNSELRRRVAPRSIRYAGARFGFRRHFRVAPWTDFVEIYWARSCQIAITPIGPEEIGVAVISRSPQIRLQQALGDVPSLARRLPIALATTAERGAPCGLRRLPRVHRHHCGHDWALIGDASGSVDPITGEGLGLAFHQATALADALAENDLRSYQVAHRRISRIPHFFSRLILAMDAHPSFRRIVLRTLAAEPALFSWVLQTRMRSHAPPRFDLGNSLRMGWKVMGRKVFDRE